MLRRHAHYPGPEHAGSRLARHNRAYHTRPEVPTGIGKPVTVDAGRTSARPLAQRLCRGHPRRSRRHCRSFGWPLHDGPRTAVQVSRGVARHDLDRRTCAGNPGYVLDKSVVDARTLRTASLAQTSPCPIVPGIALGSGYRKPPETISVFRKGFFVQRDSRANLPTVTVERRFLCGRLGFVTERPPRFVS